MEIAATVSCVIWSQNKAFADSTLQNNKREYSTKESYFPPGVSSGSRAFGSSASLDHVKGTAAREDRIKKGGTVGRGEGGDSVRSSRPTSGEE